MAKQFKLKVSQGMSPEKRKYRVSEDIELTFEQHAKLIEYISARLDFGHAVHTAKVDQFTNIAKQVAGFIRLDDDDKKRQLDNSKGLGPKVHDVNIPLVATQLDEAVTFFTTVYFPEEGPYNAVTDASKEDVAKAFSKLMNKHAGFYKHFVHFAKGSYCSLKYNRGLWVVHWHETKGSVVKNKGATRDVDVVNDAVVMSGNKLEFANPFNTILDPSVCPTELHAEGEFFATVEKKTPFRAKIMAQRREIFNLNAVIEPKTGEMHNNSDTSYYTEMPEVHGDSRVGVSSSGGKINWINVFSGHGDKKVSEGLEFINLYIWLPSAELHLGTFDGYQIWRLTLANMVCVRAELMTNAHGFLPLIAALPWDDEFGDNSTSYGEMLLPYQRFSSFQMNVHQRASRKALYNLIIYNSLLVPEMANADSLGGKVPFNSTADVNDINKALKVISDVPDTSNTVNDIDAMDKLMQKILPTDILKQVTSLERATQYQAAATVQGANRRNLKIAKLIYLQAFGVGLKMQMYNILQFQEAVEILGDGGELIQIDPAAFREQQLEFTISDGLRGLDKLILIETMKEILTLLVQNPKAADEFDIAKLINYITTLIGDHTSFKQFEFVNEFDKLDLEQKQIAFQLLQQAMQQQAQQQGAGEQQ